MGESKTEEEIKDEDDYTGPVDIASQVSVRDWKSA